MSQTVQKQQPEQSSREYDLDNTWTGLYNRWKGQLERDFNKDPSQKWKLWLHSTAGASIPILYSLITSLSAPIVIMTFLWLGIFHKQDISDMVGKTAISIMYGLGLLVYPMPFIGAIATLYLIGKLKSSPQSLQNSS
jgi:hypothetical protein